MSKGRNFLSFKLQIQKNQLMFHGRGFGGVHTPPAGRGVGDPTKKKLEILDIFPQLCEGKEPALKLIPANAEPRQEVFISYSIPRRA